MTKRYTPEQRREKLAKLDDMLFGDVIDGLAELVAAEPPENATTTVAEQSVRLKLDAYRCLITVHKYVSDLAAEAPEGSVDVAPPRDEEGKPIGVEEAKRKLRAIAGGAA